jgi:hypothetical protein
MSNSPKSVNSVTRLYGVPSRALGVGLRDRHDIVHDGLMRAPRLDGADVRPRPSAMPAMTRPDRQDSSPWSSSILAFFMEGFALYGASYCASPHVIATSRVEPSPTQANGPPPQASSWRERRKAIIIVSSSTRSEVREVADAANRAGFVDTDRSSRRNWLTKPWHAVASRWAQRRRERVIKKAIAVLELDGEGR